ncbi:MAG TPA: HU family DNA-binding protein [Oligoflexia bacterium]|nr:HU family DNA-binding protein [Oligoflexia bacterium]HMP48607.1 HU family DNA-binding protein [Oligoflexia bacterium]
MSKAKPAAKAAKVTKPKNGVQYTQGELLVALYESCGLENKKQAKIVFDGFAGMVHAALKKGYKLPLPGIGKLQVRQTKARMGRNPATGELIKIKAKRKVRLTPSKALKEAVL